MALSEWHQWTAPTGDLRELYLTSQYKYEGMRCLYVDADEHFLIHNQTLEDNPVSGAVKTAFLGVDGYSYFVGHVFKYVKDGNALVVGVYGYPNDIVCIEVYNYTDGIYDSIHYTETDVVVAPETWYISEVICDDPNNQITVRIKDADENVLYETTIGNIIPSDKKGVSGGIGLEFWAEKTYVDLTKLYYP